MIQTLGYTVFGLCVLVAIGLLIEQWARRCERKRDAAIIPWERPAGPTLPPIAQKRPQRPVRLVSRHKAGGER